MFKPFKPLVNQHIMNHKIGNTNHAAAFSFYANKNLTTGGEGGAVATNNDHLAKQIKKLSLHGITKDGWSRFKSPGKWEYDITELGYKYNLTDLSAERSVRLYLYPNSVISYSHFPGLLKRLHPSLVIP